MYCFFTVFAFCQVPLLDGSAREWVQAIEESGLVVASNSEGLPVDREVLVIEEPITSIQGDSFIAAFPAPSTRLTYGIDFPQVKSLLCFILWAKLLLVQTEGHPEYVLSV